MAAFDYAQLQAEADTAIAEAGVAAVLRRPTTSGSAYNPTAGPPEEFPCTVVVGAYRVGEVDGTRVLATDKKVLLAAGGLAVTPSPAYRLVLGGVEHTIVAVTPIEPAAVSLMFKLQVRR